MGFSTTGRPSVPPQRVVQEGQERRPLPPLCLDRSGCRSPEPVPRQRPGKPGTAQCHGCSASSPLPRPAFLSPPFLRLTLCTPSFPCYPICFSSVSPLSLNSPLSLLLLLLFLNPSPLCSSLLPSFLPLYGPGAVFQLFCLRLSPGLSLSGSVP